MTEDIQSARYKLADYYLREFTEISLYSSRDTNHKVPLQKLYVAMKWKRTGKGKMKGQRIRGKKKSESAFTDYTKIFKGYLLTKRSSTRNLNLT